MGGDSSRVQIGKAVQGQLHLCRNVNCMNTEGDAQIVVHPSITLKFCRSVYWLE